MAENASMLNETEQSLYGEDFLYNTYQIHRIAAPELLVIDRVITPIWYVIGVIGNPLSAKIWLSKKVRLENASAIYLGYIAIVHSVFIFLHIWMELLQAWGVVTFNRPILCEIFMVFFLTPQYLAPVLILGFTIERFIAICFPFLKETVCTVKRAITAVTALTIGAFVFGLCQAYVWSYDVISGVCEVRPETVAFYKIWTWISEMLIFAAVPLAVLILNILVIREIRRIKKFGAIEKKQDSQQATSITLLSVSFYLICTLLPATLVYTIQLLVKPGNLWTPPHDWSSDVTWSDYLIYYHIRRVTEEICLSNFACYVFIYYITSTYFRTEVHKIFKLDKCTKRSPRQASSFTQHYLVVTTNSNDTQPTEV